MRVAGAETRGGGIWRRFIGFTSALNAVASVWYFLVMILVTADVIGRSIFNTPLTGTPEIVKVTVVGVFFIQLPNAVWRGRLIRSDLILNRLSPRVREVFTLPMELMGLAFCVILVVSVLPDAIKAWTILDYEGEGALRVPTYPSYTLLLLGAALSGVLFIARFVVALERLLGGSKGLEGSKGA